MTHTQLLAIENPNAGTIDSDQNPDASFALWLESLEISLLGLSGDDFAALKTAFFALPTEPKPAQASTAQNPDLQCFHWLESSNVALLNLDGPGFEKAKTNYFQQTGRMQPTASEPAARALAANRFDDDFICDLLKVDVETLQAIADYGDPRRGHRCTLDAVYADSDGMLGRDDVLYLLRKKVIRDAAIACGEPV